MVVAFVMILLVVLLYLTVELYNGLPVAVEPVVAMVVVDVFGVGRNTTLVVAFFAVVTF